MIRRTEIYKCRKCSNAVEAVREGEGELYCCGEAMQLLQENTDDTASKEKHVPVFDNGCIKIGSDIHPMTEEHHIEFIEAVSPDRKYIVRKYLEHNEAPVMDTSYNYCRDSFIMREWCNLHGVWTGHKE